MVMRFFVVLVSVWLAFFAQSTRPQEPAEPGFDHEHKHWTSVLEANVRSDRVDYAALAQKRDLFDQYLAKLSSQDGAEFAMWTRDERLAFWINAYNAFTLQAVLANYPFEDFDSLRDVGGVQSGKAWKERKLPLGRLIEGHPDALISLDELRNDVLRSQFKDARVHAALCTSCLGSPALRATAFSAIGLDKQLDAAARAWLGDPLRTRFSKERKLVETSAVFDDFRADFLRESASVEVWIARFAPPEERAWIEKVDRLERATLPFDWKLNDVPHDKR
ncbi:MAG TPA: DUF547 domain-containing protein [Planctomycetota bacterium]|nr:DUF547 domain-containing protein [Planctomycetota bacterium]